MNECKCKDYNECVNCTEYDECEQKPYNPNASLAFFILAIWAGIVLSILLWLII